jgi:hypothetical protein
VALRLVCGRAAEALRLLESAATQASATTTAMQASRAPVLPKAAAVEGSQALGRSAAQAVP